MMLAQMDSDWHLSSLRYSKIHNKAGHLPISRTSNLPAVSLLKRHWFDSFQGGPRKLMRMVNNENILLSKSILVVDFHLSRYRQLLLQILIYHYSYK